MFSTNRALLYTLIPKGVDPCDPGNRFALMVVDGATGSASKNASNYTTTGGNVGGVLSSPSPPGDPMSQVGGGQLIIPGLPPALNADVLDAINEALGDDVWHRGAWRELLNIH